MTEDYLFKFIEDGTVMDVYYELTEPKAGTLEELISVAGSFSMQTVILTIYEMVRGLDRRSACSRRSTKKSSS